MARGGQAGIIEATTVGKPRAKENGLKSTSPKPDHTIASNDFWKQPSLTIRTQSGSNNDEQGEGKRLIFHGDDPLIDNICAFANQRLPQALEDNMKTFKT